MRSIILGLLSACFLGLTSCAPYFDKSTVYGDDAGNTDPLARAEAAVHSMVEKAALDPTRPIYHFTSPAQWMNDINGPIYYKGYYHIFYQHNPYEDKWGNMHWGHARSHDMVNWQHLPIALRPSLEKGERHCFSGCLAVNGANEPVILYTSIGHPLPEQWAAKGSDDLLTWQKYPENPILKMSDHNGLLIKEWRDPFILRAAGQTYMVLGGTLQEKDGNQHAVFMYQAGDDSLLKWDYKGILFKHPNRQAASLECPNFFPLDKRFVLLCSPYGLVEYFTGSFNSGNYSFAADVRGLIDYSNDYYATNIMHDDKGRCIMLGWVRGFQEGRGWNGCMSLPRIISVNSNGRLIQKPAPELEKLRVNCADIPDFTLEGESRLLSVTGDTLEVQAVIRPGSAEKCGFRVRCDLTGGDGVEIAWQADKLIVAQTEVPLGNNGTITLHFFLDKSVLEVFINDGLAAVTRVVYPDIHNSGIQVFSSGGKTAFESVKIWQLAKANNEYHPF